MKLEMLAQSTAFLLLTILLAMLLGVAVRFEVSRLVISIALAGGCLLAELYVIVKILLRLWRWSGAVSEVLFKSESKNHIDRQVSKAR
jgi:hypothetical protein